MLYVYYGHQDDARKKVQATIQSLLKKKQDAHYIRITTENKDEYDLSELVSAQALFNTNYIVLFDGLFAEKDSEIWLSDFLSEIADSHNTFFVLEGVLKSPQKKKLEKHTQKISYFEESTKKTQKKSDFNTFALADKLGERNKKMLWVLYQEALSKGISVEEVVGILYWNIKSMILTSNSASESETGLKPFVANKAKRFAQNFTQKELFVLLINLSTLLPHARREGQNSEIVLEKFILNL